MNNRSWTSYLKLPRLLLVLAVFMIPQLASAYFYVPSDPHANTQYSIAWYGSVGTNPGVYVSLQVKAPGSSSWSTIVTGVSGYYGSTSVGTSYTFGATGAWELRVIRSDTGALVEATSFYVGS